MELLFLLGSLPRYSSRQQKLLPFLARCIYLLITVVVSASQYLKTIAFRIGVQKLNVRTSHWGIAASNLDAPDINRSFYFNALIQSAYSPSRRKYVLAIFNVNVTYRSATSGRHVAEQTMVNGLSWMLMQYECLRYPSCL